jgi:hypothetical protein
MWRGTQLTSARNATNKCADRQPIKHEGEVTYDVADVPGNKLPQPRGPQVPPPRPMRWYEPRLTAATFWPLEDQSHMHILHGRAVLTLLQS